MYADDAGHDKACAMLEEVAEGKWGVPIVLDMVVAELFNLVRARTSDARVEDAADRLLFDRAACLPRVRAVSLGVERLRLVVGRWVRHRDDRLSFVDAALLVMRDSIPDSRIMTLDGRLATVAARPAE